MPRVPGPRAKRPPPVVARISGRTQPARPADPPALPDTFALSGEAPRATRAVEGSSGAGAVGWSAAPIPVPRLHLLAPTGQAVPVSVRRASFAEAEALLLSDESDESAANCRAHWTAHPEAYYRWELGPSAEMGLVTDLARQTFYAKCAQAPEGLPFVAVTQVEGQERVVGFSTVYGDVHFHADSALRAQGWRGIGTALVAHYLEECRRDQRDAGFDSVNGSYGFYEKLGFEYSDPNHTPSLVPDPATGRFPMHLPLARIPSVLERLFAQDTARTTDRLLPGAG
jgi:GNAT superfamily N-acetyltransferase